MLLWIHPFFVSMTDLNFNDKDKTLEVSVRIFTDDFENTLRKYHKDKIDILHPANKTLMNEYVSNYLKNHLQISINNSQVSLEFLGYEQEEESIWSYFQVSNITSIQKIEIENSLLYELTHNQINLVHAKVGSKEQSSRLDYPNTHLLFSF
jgi:hypothetical protein